MLILSRKAGEVIFVGDNIRIVVVATSKYNVRLGIEAPKEIPIMREELLSLSVVDGAREVTAGAVETITPS